MDEITLNKPYITLGQVLQLSGVADSGAQAKILVKKLKISVNQVSENRRGRKLFTGDLVTIEEKQILIK